MFCLIFFFNFAIKCYQQQLSDILQKTWQDPPTPQCSLDWRKATTVRQKGFELQIEAST